MADPQQLDFSSVGGKPVQSPPAGGLDFSSVGGKPVTADVPANTETAQPATPPAPKPAQPGALARFGENAAQALGKGSLGNTNEEVKQRLKEIAQHPVDNTLAFGKGILDAQGELAHKAKEAWKNGDHVGAAAYALYYLMPGIGPSLAKAGEQMSSGDIAGGLGTTAGTAAPMLMDVVKPEVTVPKTGFKAVAEANAREAAVKSGPKTASAEEVRPQATSLKEAGQKVQTEAQEKLDTAGKNVDAAKEKASAKVTSTRQLPASSEAQTKATQKLVPKPTIEPKALKSAADKIADVVSDDQQLAGAKDPGVDELKATVDHLVKGANAKGEPLSLDQENIDSIKRTFDKKIAQLSATPGNKTVLGQWKQLKTAYLDDVYDAYEKHGDKATADTLRNANKEYATVIKRQTSAPVKVFLKNVSPEQIPLKIIKGGAGAQTAVEGIVKDISPEGAQTLRDSVLRELERRNTMSDGTINMDKVRKQFYALGDTAKALYGDSLKETTDYLDAASKEQATRLEAAKKTSVGKEVLKRGMKAAGAGGGAYVGSAFGPAGTVGGAIVGDTLAEDLTNAFFQNGKSGAVKIGISPTERIVLSPAQASAARPAITRFLKAKSAGNAAAMMAAYNAIANPVRKPDNKP